MDADTRGTRQGMQPARCMYGTKVCTATQSKHNLSGRHLRLRRMLLAECVMDASMGCSTRGRL